MLEVVPDRWTHTSDHFDTLLELCERLLKEGKAFVDDTDSDTMRKEREERQDSKNRNNRMLLCGVFASNNMRWCGLDSKAQSSRSYSRTLKISS